MAVTITTVDTQCLQFNDHEQRSSSDSLQINESITEIMSRLLLVMNDFDCGEQEV